MKTVNSIITGVDSAARAAITSQDAEHAMVKTRPLVHSGMTLGAMVVTAMGKPPTNTSQQLKSIRANTRRKFSTCQDQIDGAVTTARMFADIADYIDGKSTMPMGVPGHLEQAARVAKMAIEKGVHEPGLASELRRASTAALVRLNDARAKMTQLIEVADIAATKQASLVYSKLANDPAYSDVEQGLSGRMHARLKARFEVKRDVYRKVYGVSHGY